MDTAQNQKTQNDQQVVNPVGSSVAKEQGPIVSSPAQTSEFIAPSEPEPQIPEEVKEAGVEAVPHHPKLNSSHAQVGIQHAKEATPVIVEPSGMIKTPITEEKAKEVLKTNKNPVNSIVWLATEVLKNLSIIKKN